MIDQSFEIPGDLSLELVVQDAMALFEQYEPVNEADAPAVADDTCENLYATPW